MVAIVKELRRPARGFNRLNPRHWLYKDLVFVHNGERAFAYGKPILPINTSNSLKGTSSRVAPSFRGSRSFIGIISNFEEYAVSTPTYPFTLSVWNAMNGADGAQPSTLICTGSAAARNFGNIFRSATTSDPAIGAGDVNASVSVTATGTIVNNVQQHLVGRFFATNSRELYVDGVFGASDGTVRAIGNGDRVNIHAGHQNSAGAIAGIARTACVATSLPMVIGRALSPAEIARLYNEQRVNPWGLFLDDGSPFQIPIAVLVLCRPTSDILTTGWTASTGSDLYAMVDESTASDSDYITSPLLSSPTPNTFGITPSAPTGTHTVRIRGSRTETTGQVRVHLLDASNAVMGSSAWQALTSSFTTYPLSITTSGAATRMQIEVAP